MGTIIRWDGAKWNNITGPTTSDLNSVSMVDASDGWAVGSHGAIILYDEGKWIPEFPTVTLIPLLIILTFVAAIQVRASRERRVRKHNSHGFETNNIVSGLKP